MKYNTIIIGGGLGGLIAGATLSKFGKKVLLLEQHYKPGGCATTFKRGEFIIEVGLHEMDGLDEKDFKVQMFEMLDVFNHVEFVKVPELYAFFRENQKFVFPDGFENITRAMLDQYPEDEKGIRRFRKLLEGIRTEVRKLPNKEWKQKLFMPVMPLLYPNLVEANKHTVGSWLDKYITNEELKMILAAHVIYYGDDPHELSMFYYGMAQSGFIGGGGNYIKGGASKLSDHLASFIEKNGGSVFLGKKVQKIITENGRVTGVTYVDLFNADAQPQTVHSDNVIANCAIPLVTDMLDEQHARDFKNLISPFEISNSMLCLYLGFNSTLSRFGVDHYSNYISGSQVNTLQDVHPNQHGDWSDRSFIFVDYGQVDSQLAPSGKNVGVICAVDFIEDWADLNKQDYKAKKEEVKETLLLRLEKQFPGIRDSIVYSEIATPKTIQRFTLNPKGNFYGYKQSKKQSGFKRLRDNFFLPNLYFASAWTYPGGGFGGTIQGGFLTALSMNNNEKWQKHNGQLMQDDRIVPLIEKKNISENLLELTFDKPPAFHHQKGQYAVLRLKNPGEMKLDLPYRWLPIISEPDENNLRFHIPIKESSFENNCKDLAAGEEAIIFGPMS